MKDRTHFERHIYDVRQRPLWQTLLVWSIYLSVFATVAFGVFGPF
jgi:hypothetical protein